MYFFSNSSAFVSSPQNVKQEAYPKCEFVPIEVRHEKHSIFLSLDGIIFYFQERPSKKYSILLCKGDMFLAVADPDLEIRVWGWGWERSSRPLDKGGAGLPKKFFGPFGPQCGLKIRGRAQAPWAPPLDPLLFGM